MRFRIVTPLEIYAWDVIIGWSINGGSTFEMTTQPVTITAVSPGMIFGSMDGGSFQMAIDSHVRLMERID